MRITSIALTATLAAAGCGGGSTAPTPVPTSLAITRPPGNFLFLGETYTFGMVAELSNGGVVPTGGTWGSDAPSVAVVEPATGQVQIVGVGQATIYVDYKGQRASVLIRTTVRYEGTLDAPARITRCTATGIWKDQDPCRPHVLGAPSVAFVTFTQADTSVTAVMDLSGCIGGASSLPAAATVSDTGELVFEAIHRDESITVRGRWSLRPVGLNQVQGTVVYRTTSTWTSGFLEREVSVGPSAISTSAASVRECPID